MLSKRNFFMMMTMIAIILVLFLSSAVLKAYFNDYDVNHAAETPLIEKESQLPGTSGGADDQTDASSMEQVLYFGGTENDCYRAVSEWAGYRKRSLRVIPSLEELPEPDGGKSVCLILDGEALANDPETAAGQLSQYVRQGGVVIFYRLPPYRVIEGCDALKNLLGIQFLRGESVELAEIRLFSGFLLGGETHYSFVDGRASELVDLNREVPWYDISSRTKTYMAGFLSEEQKSDGLNNEDMPALIWRSSLGAGSVFAVNGDYMMGESALGFLDAMLYEASDYTLYSVVNAQNLLFVGFPDLTVENETVMAEVYGMTTQQFCRDVLWPSLVATTQKGGWKGTAFFSVKQSDQSANEPNQVDLIDYLKFFNEESAEAGVCLGRLGSPDVRSSVEDEYETLSDFGLHYVFAGGYIRNESRDQLPRIIGSDGRMEYFQDLRTVVGEYDADQQILSWLTDRITLQNATTDAYRHSDQDSLWLKSLETALGYSNIMVDLYRVLWPGSSEDEWQTLADKMSSNVDTFWKPFAAFDKTTISESDSRVRDFLNGSVESTRDGDTIRVRTSGYTGDAWLLLRTHGERPDSMTGGTWKAVEENAYLLHLTDDEASVRLRTEQEIYYHE